MPGDGLAREGIGRPGPGPRDRAQQLRTSVLDPRKAAGLGLLLVPSQLCPPRLPERTSKHGRLQLLAAHPDLLGVRTRPIVRAGLTRAVHSAARTRCPPAASLPISRETVGPEATGPNTVGSARNMPA